MRPDFLAHAGELLDETSDYQQTLRAVAEIAVPEVADWCAVSVLNRRFPADEEPDSATYVVARTGATQDWAGASRRWITRITAVRCLPESSPSNAAW